MKKILIVLLITLLPICLYAEKKINYRGIFPSDRAADAEITNYILLKKDTRVEFLVEEQGRGPTNLVQITEVQLTSDSDINLSASEKPITGFDVSETGIYRVKLQPTQPSGAEIRFVLVVTEKAIGSKPEKTEVSVEITSENALHAVSPVTVATFPMPASTSIEILETPAPVLTDSATFSESLESESVRTDLSDLASFTESQPALATVSETASPTHTCLLLSPAKSVYLNPFKGFVFSTNAENPKAFAEQNLSIYLTGIDGEKMPVSGEFFSAAPGQVTFLPGQLVPGAIYQISNSTGETEFRAAFPQLSGECEFLTEKTVVKLFWSQQPMLQATQLAQMVRLENVEIRINDARGRLLTQKPDQVLPYGVVGPVNYRFRPYELLFEIKNLTATESGDLSLEVAATIDGADEPAVVFKQEFSSDFHDVPAGLQSADSDASTETEPEISELADLPEDSSFFLVRSFSSSENMAEVNRAWPEEICWSESGTIWVIDSQRHRLVNFSATGKLKLAFGAKGSENGQMLFPVALTLKQGRIFVSDTTGHCLHKFGEDGSFLARVISDPAVGALINVPGGLCFRGNELWVVDRGLSKLSCFDVEGKYLGGFGSENGLISSPLSVRSDQEGLLVLEKSGIVKKFSPMGQQIAGFQTGCVEPRGFDVDTWGTIWVCDASKFQVVRFNQKGRQLAVIKAPPGPRPWVPTGVAVRKDGLIAVSDAENKKIHIFSVER